MVLIIDDFNNERTANNFLFINKLCAILPFEGVEYFYTANVKMYLS